MTIDWDPRVSAEDVATFSRALAQRISENFPKTEVQVQVFAPRDEPETKLYLTTKEHGRRWNKEEIMDAIRIFYVENGRTPTSVEWASPGPWPNIKTVRRHFGSWGNAIVEAGFARPIPGCSNLINRLVNETIFSSLEMGLSR